MTTLAVDPVLLQAATAESLVAYWAYVEGSLGRHKTSAEVWRDAYVHGYLDGHAARPIEETKADLAEIARADEQLAADVQAEADRARERDRSAWRAPNF